MVEHHRRVEPRGIVGTGMSTDPEKIREIEEEAERKKRAWKNAPDKGFGEVLQEAPAKGHLADEEEEPSPKKRPEKAPPPAAMTTQAMESPAQAAPAPPAKALPKVAPDPREAALRKKLEQAQSTPKNVFQTDTPPTGSRTRKPT